ncbi:Reverse transcriptase-like [Fragilaria crotonensis]|nr:Reverse transcriptase-like [Fragilaria crotonensis]
MAKKKNQFYAVAVGRIPGIYTSWDDCKKQTEGFKAAKFKSFATNGEALAFVEQYRIRDSTATNEPPISKRQQNCSAASINHVLSITIHFDGGSRGNPGLGGAGAQVMLTETSNETEVTERLLHLSCFLGSHRVTNNEAEYHGMLLALDEALKQVGAFAERHPPASSCQVAITINGDSDLIIQQMLGNYQVRSDNLVPLYRQANERIASIKQIMDTGSV